MRMLFVVVETKIATLSESHLLIKHTAVTMYIYMYVYMYVHLPPSQLAEPARVVSGGVAVPEEERIVSCE
jgi:hypothetical protein